MNSFGQFNVPYGRPKTKSLVDSGNLLACSRVLKAAGLQIRNVDFEEATAEAVEGDFIYFDPPYVTGHNNNGFVDYNERLFSWADQERLAKVAKKLSARGVKIVVSNANHRAVIKLFDGFRRRIVTRSSTLASLAKHRGSVSEVILFS